MNPVTGLSLGRIIIGAASVANPAMVTKAFGLDVEANPQTTFMTHTSTQVYRCQNHCKPLQPV